MCCSNRNGSMRFDLCQAFWLPDSAGVSGPISRLPGVVQSGGDAIHSSADGVVEGIPFFAGAFAAQQVNLDEAHGIHVRIAQANGAIQQRVTFEKVALPGYLKNCPPRALELLQ